MEIFKTKTCPKCAKDLPTTLFAKNRNRSDGLNSWCKSCAQPYIISANKLNRVKINKRVQETRRTLREKVLNIYGGKCTCCGESEPRFLSFDHINGDGSQHRKQDREASRNIYNWLEKNNYPSSFQILCHNCNMAKGFYGICPHKEEND